MTLVEACFQLHARRTLLRTCLRRRRSTKAGAPEQVLHYYPAVAMFKPTLPIRSGAARAAILVRYPRFLHSIGAAAHGLSRDPPASVPHVPTRSFATATTSTIPADHVPNPAFVSRATLNKIAPAEPSTRHLSTDAETPNVFPFFEKATSTWQYIVVDPKTAEAVIIDPVLDYDPASGAVTTTTADGLVSFIEHNGLKVTRIL